MSSSEAADVPESSRIIHPLFVRVTHWINAFAIFCMVLSGWRIYNASPLFDFKFPREITLGGWLGGALQWHFAAMWILLLNGLFYLVLGFVSGHFRRDFLPIHPRDVWQVMKEALSFKLAHQIGEYNAVQKLLYVGVIGLILLVVLSGFAIWKPVQFYPLTFLMGGYESARYVHFFAMTGIVGFILVHLALVALVPATFLPMITGRTNFADHHEDEKGETQS